MQAAFSFLGTEIVALTAGEAENPRRNVPKAIRRVFYRVRSFSPPKSTFAHSASPQILFFYVIGVFIM